MRFPFLVLHLVAGDVLVDLLRYRGVVAHHNEHRRLAQKVEGAFAALAHTDLVFPVILDEHLQCGDERRRQHRRGFLNLFAFFSRFAARLLLPFLRQAVTAGAVQIAQHRLGQLLARIVDREERDFHQAGFDRLDQPEVRDHPGKERVRGPAGPGEVIRRGREVVYRAHLKAPADLRESAEPDGSAFVLRFTCFFLRIAAFGERQIAVMGFIVQNQQAPALLELSQYPAQQEVEVLFLLLFLARLEVELAVERAALVAGQHPGLEGMVVGDHDPGVQGVQFAFELLGHQRPLAVIIQSVRAPVRARIHGKNLQPVADGDAGSDNEKVVRVARVAAVLPPVEEVVQDQAGHNDGLARTGRHLESNARQHLRRIGRYRALRLREPVQQVRAGIRAFGDLVDPDCRFHRFLLCEEELVAVFARRIEKPELQQFTSHSAGDARIPGRAPCADFAAHQVDQVFLVLDRKFVDIEHPRLGLRERNDRRVGREYPAMVADVLVIEVARLIGRVVRLRLLVRGVEDWITGIAAARLRHGAGGF